MTTATLVLFAACDNAKAPEVSGDPTIPHAPAKLDPQAAIERGRYLVAAGACNDCHTPFKMGPNGPAPDMTRALSGHPADMVMPPVPAMPAGPWIGAMSATNTAWAGPWGVSFTANLTPDKETGLGAWTKQNFVDTIRNGRHLGNGRPLLPPMPSPSLAMLTDDDLGAMFAYLQTLPPIANKVPAPIPPDASSSQVSTK